jgi:hypothetical protein
VAVTKRYCIDDAVVNYKPEEFKSEDLNRVNIYNAVFGEEFPLKELLGKIRTYRKIGKDADCDIEYLFYLQMLVEYFQIIKEETNCASVKGFDELAEEYKLACIENILTCNYGLGNLIGDLVELLGLRTPYNGIGYMTISLDDCKPFIVY